MTEVYRMGVDIGTTSTKAVLFNGENQVVEQMGMEYPLHTPEAGAAEQDPDEIVRAVQTAIHSVMKTSQIKRESLQFIAFSAAMHSLIAVNEEGKPLTPSITWADQRSEAFAEQLKENKGQQVYERTGTPIHPMSPLPKLMWLKEERIDLFQKAEKFIGIKEYVFKQLFDQYVIDHSVASATGLMNRETMDWDEEALEIAGISREHLSELVPTTTCFQGIDHSTAEAYGINPQTPFIIGANDGCLANLGVGAIEKGTVALTIGTSGAIRTVSSEPVVDPKGRTFCYALTKDHWVIGGPVNNGGMVLRWLRDEWCQEEVAEAKERGISAYELITEKIDQVRPGAEGLLFHPYLTGERAPSWNAHARGSFFGLAMHHKREHMMRAVLEGINLNIYMVLLALEELIGIPDKIHATGGFAQSSVWRQMVADIFNQDVHVQQTVESSCFGAVVLGLYAMGEIKDLTAVKDFVQTSEVTMPNRKNVETYEEIIPIFIRLSRLFEEEYEAVADLQHKLGQNTDGSNIK